MTRQSIDVYRGCAFVLTEGCCFIIGSWGDFLFIVQLPEPRGGNFS